MADAEKDLTLDNLKMDPRLWLRLTMPLDKSGVLGNVFTGKENPFEKDPNGSMEKIQKLAADGQLYLRDKGRSRHFHEVKVDKDGLKLGEKREMKFGNRHTDPVLGVLMWLSRGYFKLLGFNGISNWFDERLKRRAAVTELNDQYKEEYKEMSEAERNRLKALRKHEKAEIKAQKKHEKNLKKLEKLQKEIEKSQKSLDKLQGKTGTNSLGEMDSPLNTQPPANPDKTTMQPTLLGDPRQHEKDEVKQTELDNLISKDPKDNEITGENKGKVVKKDEQADTILNNVSISNENAKQLPEAVQDALKVINQFIEQQKAIERDFTNQQQQKQTQAQETLHDDLLIDSVDDVNLDNGHQNEEQLNTNNTNPSNIEQNAEENINWEDVQIPPNQNTKQQAKPVNVAEDLQQLYGNYVPENIINLNDVFGAQQPQQQPQPQEQQAELPYVDLVSLKSPEYIALQNRLAANKQAMDAVENWQDTLANSLFSHEQGKPMMDFYQSMKQQQPESSMEYLSGAVFGVLGKASADPQKTQQVMDALLSGRSVGDENNDLIRDGMTAYQNQTAALGTKAGQNEFAQTLANAVLALSQQASREQNLSSRHVMIGRLISNAMTIADNNRLLLPLKNEDWATVRGAFHMANLAQKYHDAQQYLGQEAMDVYSATGRNAVNALLTGYAVETMMRQDQLTGPGITSAQIFLGRGIWSPDKLQEMVNHSAQRRSIDQNQVRTLLENPDSSAAFGIGKAISSALYAESMGLSLNNNSIVKQNEMEMVDNQQLQQQLPSNVPFN